MVANRSGPGGQTISGVSLDNLGRRSHFTDDSSVDDQKRSDRRIYEGGGYAAAPPRLLLAFFTYMPHGPGIPTREMELAR